MSKQIKETDFRITWVVSVQKTSHLRQKNSFKLCFGIWHDYKIIRLILEVLIMEIPIMNWKPIPTMVKKIHVKPNFCSILFSTFSWGYCQILLK